MSELTFWCIALVVTVIAFSVLWHFAKKEAENYVDVEDWE